MNTVSHIPTGEVLFEFHHATFFARGELLFFNEEGAVVGMHDLQSGEICFGEKLWSFLFSPCILSNINAAARTP